MIKSGGYWLPHRAGNSMNKLLLSAVTLLIFCISALAASSKEIKAVTQPKSALTTEELKMARECQKGKPCSLTCNRAHEAGRDDLIRKGACAE
jgi:hypothetical protein